MPEAAHAPIPKEYCVDKPNDEREFAVTAIQKCAAPDGKRSGQWHRYTVENQLTTIQGYAKGSKTEVTRHASEYVENLNLKNDPKHKATVRRVSKRIKAAVAAN